MPKRLALNGPERLATAIAKPMQALSKVAYPIVHVLGLSTEFVLRLLGIKPSTEPSVTEEEIRAGVQRLAAVLNHGEWRCATEHQEDRR